jgi:ribosomal protein S18 acetylase RimI-like enzyme
LLYKDLQIKELEAYYSIFLSLLEDTYITNFQVSEIEARRISLEKLKILMDYMKLGTAKVIIACLGEELIGFIWLYKHDYFTEKRFHINQLAVNREYRGKGVGTQLIREAEKHAEKEGIDIIDLFVSENNPGAFRLYDSLGFETERRYMKKKL